MISEHAGTIVAYIWNHACSTAVSPGRLSSPSASADAAPGIGVSRASQSEVSARAGVDAGAWVVIRAVFLGPTDEDAVEPQPREQSDHDG